MDHYQNLKSMQNMDGFGKKNKGMKRPSMMLLLVVIILICGVLMTILNIYQLQQMKQEHDLHTNRETIIVEAQGSIASENYTRKGPVVWLNGKNLYKGYLNHVKNVFERLGFFISIDGTQDWDVMWMHDFPFVSMATTMQNLKPHQKVNHFPGLGFITNKGSLATSKSKAIPTAFKIPQDKEKFIKHTKKFPDKLWVQKNNNHRGIRVKAVHELDLSRDGTFVQEFIGKPLLVDGRKFDIGIYTILTSLNPMRLYVIDDEALVRFCPTEYYPFDPEDVNKYVVHDDYKPMWEMPSLSDMYTNKKYSFKETLTRHLIKKGHNATKIWSGIYDTIKNIYLEKYPKFMTSVNKFKSIRNFFEMVRFDFVVDTNLEVYLMEVNMSPNLSTGHFKGNRRLYEHVVYNLLRLVGVASMVENHFNNEDKDMWEMLVSDRVISVFSEWCTSTECANSCDSLKCSVCSQCLSTKDRQDFKDAYLEHINRGGCTRVYPPKMTPQAALRWTPEIDNLKVLQENEQNRKLYLWYIGMCRKNQAFCL